MAKNILLLFLSDVKTALADGKVVVQRTPYANVSGDDTQTTNESAVRYLIQQGISLDKIFIFASELVRKEIYHFDRETKKSFQFVGDDGEPCTHLKFFVERVKNFLPNVDFDVYDYDESKSGDENLTSVTEMAGRIQKFAAGDEIILHVDLTGGMRDVNMMMLDLTRLLEYSGLKIDTLLYSNFGKRKVEEVKNIYDLFQLIAGVEEFVNFGSVTALKSYYVGKKLSASLKRLLTAMENFAEAIKLCHYGQFRDAIINLHDAVHDFTPATNDLQDILMARLIGRIREDYHQLIINRELDDLRVIRWCLRHDYLQQALTLYTERVPEYLGKKNFLSLSDEEAQKNFDADYKKDTMHRNRFYYLLGVYSPPLPKNPFDGLNKFCNAVKMDAINAIRRKSFDFDAWLKNLKSELSLHNFLLEDENYLRAQLKTLAKIGKEPWLLDDLSSAELVPLRKIIDAFKSAIEEKPCGSPRAKFLLRAITSLPNRRSAAKQKLFTDFFPTVVLKYPPRTGTIHDLINAGIFSVNIPAEKFLDIMGKYFLIRDERNHSNHALEVSGKFTTASELKNFLLNALAEIEENLPA